MEDSAERIRGGRREQFISENHLFSEINRGPKKVTNRNADKVAFGDESVTAWTKLELEKIEALLLFQTFSCSWKLEKL